MRFYFKTGYVLCTAFFSLSAFAHKGHHHTHSDSAATLTVEKIETLEKIGKAYNQSVRPIFEKKCMDCHSGKTIYPWYYKIPGVKQYIDHDIAEAREHLDFEAGFPFKSHATPPEDLDAIHDNIRDESMPPFGYRLFHSDSRLSEAEKAIVLDWVKTSKAFLGEKIPR